MLLIYTAHSEDMTYFWRKQLPTTLPAILV